MDYRDRIADERVSMQGLLDGHQAGIWTALPGIVQAVQYDKITLSIQPAIQAIELSPDGTKSNVTLPQLVDVPVVYPRGGGYSLTFPIKQNDEALVVFSSRCIDNWWDQGGVQPQFEQRHHDLSDGFALVGPYSQKTKIANVSTATAQFRSDDGKYYFELDGTNEIARMVTPSTSVACNENAGTVTLDVSGTTININSGTVTVTASSIALNGSVTIGGDTTINGHLQTNGSIDATGSIHGA